MTVPARIPPDEMARLDALYRLQTLDTGFDQTFYQLVQIVAKVLKIPVALVSLVDQERQWFKARVGVDFQETSRDIAFCAHAILESSVMVVEDATLDFRFRNNPLVTERPNIRFYAGAPITSADGHRFGTVCAMDTKARRLTVEERQLLETVAEIAGREFAVSRACHDAIAAKTAAEQAVVERDRLVTYLAHDIRSPLGAMIGFAELMLADSREGLSTRQREHLEMILAGGTQLLTLVDDVVRKSQLDDGQQEPVLAPTDMRPLLTSAVRLLAPLSQRTGIIVSIEVKPAPDAIADKVWISQILANLLSNAIKYNQRDGKVVLRYGQESVGRVYLSVADTGQGIPPDRRSELFKPFNRLGREGSSVSGTGLGLAIVKRQVELMGGEIRVSDAIGGGTVITIDLPAAPMMPQNHAS